MSDSTVSAKTLENYRLLNLLGRGAYGEVYRAEDTRQPGRIVALKLLNPSLTADATTVQRFEREAQILARLQHRNIVRFYEFGQDNGRYFISMQYVNGYALRDAFAAQQPLEWAKMYGWLAPFAETLDFLHAQGILHRDIKPGNILIEVATNQPLLTDFGIGKDQHAEDMGLTQTGFQFGTPDYMAPEQFELKPITPATDRYALALIAYQALTGKRPFQDLAARLGQTPPDICRDNPALPPALTKIFNKALARNPQQRYDSAQAFVQALTQAMPLPVLPSAEAHQRQKIQAEVEKLLNERVAIEKRLNALRDHKPFKPWLKVPDGVEGLFMLGALGNFLGFLFALAVFFDSSLAFWGLLLAPLHLIVFIYLFYVYFGNRLDHAEKKDPQMDVYLQQLTADNEDDL